MKDPPSNNKIIEKTFQAFETPETKFRAQPTPLFTHFSLKLFWVIILFFTLSQSRFADFQNFTINDFSKLASIFTHFSSRLIWERVKNEESNGIGDFPYPIHLFSHGGLLGRYVL